MALPLGDDRGDVAIEGAGGGVGGGGCAQQGAATFVPGERGVGEHAGVAVVAEVGLGAAAEGRLGPGAPVELDGEAEAVGGGGGDGVVEATVGDGGREEVVGLEPGAIEAERAPALALDRGPVGDPDEVEAGVVDGGGEGGQEGAAVGGVLGGPVDGGEREMARSTRVPATEELVEVPAGGGEAVGGEVEVEGAAVEDAPVFLMAHRLGQGEDDLARARRRAHAGGGGGDGAVERVEGDGRGEEAVEQPAPVGAGGGGELAAVDELGAAGVLELEEEEAVEEPALARPPAANGDIGRQLRRGPRRALGAALIDEDGVAGAELRLRPAGAASNDRH
jgi:hypothetical protein